MANQSVSSTIIASSTFTAVIPNAITVSGGSILTVTFSKNLLLYGVNDPGNYQVTAIGGGVPSMVLSAVPIQSVPGVVTGVTLYIYEPTSSSLYLLTVSGLQNADGTPFNASAQWRTATGGPQVTDVEYIPANGSFLLTFSKQMMIDTPLLNPAVYSISGPTVVNILGVRTASANQVVLLTLGVGSGSYSVFVAAP
jgi:hypothetical protein